MRIILSVGDGSDRASTHTAETTQGVVGLLLLNTSAAKTCKGSLFANHGIRDPIVPAIIYGMHMKYHDLPQDIFVRHGSLPHATKMGPSRHSQSSQKLSKTQCFSRSAILNKAACIATAIIEMEITVTAKMPSARSWSSCFCASLVQQEILA